ncbi:NAD(P)-dependent oxidoreductase [Caballeronia sp. 15711]|uniref:NAD(P)-dependent oxidoreductase n=1 Tax=Caballeronia sp. 15711 TaxID=3391029 RepID=UPI0039E50BEA
MRIVYWAKMSLAKKELQHALDAEIASTANGKLDVVEDYDALLAALPGADALILPDAPPAMAGPICQALSSPEGTVRWMHFLTAGREGFEAVGLPDGVVVTSPGAAISSTVAEHGMALLLVLVRQIPLMLSAQARHEWSWAAVAPHARSLEGMTVAIVGYGRIGREVAQRARAFGMHVIGISRSGKSDDLAHETVRMADLYGVLRRADVVVLTLPLMPETHHLCNASFFDHCKLGALLINVARGGVIDQVALSIALTNGRLAGCAIDATDPEPLPPDDPLWKAPNLIISPHCAGSGSAASSARLANGAAANLRRFVSGERMENQLN